MQDLGFNTRQVLIGGQWRACSSGQTLPLHNPSDGSPRCSMTSLRIVVGPG